MHCFDSAGDGENEQKNLEAKVCALARNTAKHGFPTVSATFVIIIVKIDQLAFVTQGMTSYTLKLTLISQTSPSLVSLNIKQLWW